MSTKSLQENIQNSIEVSGRAIIATRIINAPRALVFKVWTEPDHLAKWWGPTGFTNTITEMNVQSGGRTRLMMHGPDGTDYPNRMIFTEVVAPERLVYEHDSDVDDDPRKFHVTVTFDEYEGKTRLTMTAVLPSAEELERVAREYGAIEGNKQTMDKLEAYVAAISDGGSAATGKQLVITRTLNAPRTLVFKAWSEAERLAQWWGPKGFELTVYKLEFRPGGEFHYGMKSAEGFEMFGKFVYGEIAEPGKIGFVSSFADKDGNTIRAPFSEVWPLEMRNVLMLEEQDGKTMLTLSGGPVNATEEERKIYEGMFDSMQQGFSGTFDKLDEFLAEN
jgi:uncharacterized protein YndB with AHSA1/START domain